MTKFSNILKKPCFWPSLGTFSQFLGQKKFSWKIQHCHTQHHMGLWHPWKDRRTDGRTDRPYFIGPFQLLPGVQKDGTSMERADIQKKVEMIAGKSGKELKQTIMKMYPNLFKGLGKIEPEHPIKLKEDISPNIHPPRNIPSSLQEKIKEELDNMEKTGVIRNIGQPTEWVNSMVVVEKPSGGLRICLDPRDLNKAVKREYYQLPIFE